jgi:hypothetical protein
MLVYLFDGVRPNTVADIPFDWTDSRVISQNAICRLDGCSVSPWTDAQGKPQGISMASTGQRTFTREFHQLDSADLSDNTFTFPGAYYRHSNVGGVTHGWYNDRLFHNFNRNADTYYNIGWQRSGFTPYIDMFFGDAYETSNQLVAGIKFQQRSIRAEYSGGGTIRTAFAYARTIRVDFWEPNGDGTMSLVTGTNQSVPSTGYNKLAFPGGSRECVGVRVYVISGTGTSIMPRNQNRGYWSVRYMQAYGLGTDGIQQGGSYLPTWAIVYNRNMGDIGASENILPHPFFSYVGQDHDTGVFVVDVGGPSSGATIELAGYPVAAGVSPQVQKFNFEIVD